MNTTNSWVQRKNTFTHHMRRNSLEVLSKVKNTTVHQQQQNFRRSCTSFDKISKKNKQELPQIKYEKQMDSNIYFNPHSRANYFKNLIDSYFDKNQNKQKINKTNQTQSKGSYLLRRSILNKKNQTVILEPNQNDKNQPILSLPTQIKQLKSFVSVDKLPKKQQKQIMLINKKTINAKISALQLQDQISQYTQSGNLNIQKNNFIQNSNFGQPSFLPKITEAIDDDYDEETQISSRQQLLTTTDNFMRSQSSFSRLQDKKTLIYQNGAIKLFTSWQNQRKYRIKQFKNYIFLKRHNRALQCGAYSFWKPYKFNQLSLITPYIYPLKDLLFKLIPHPTSPDYYIIQPKPLYHRLTTNHCQQLFLLFRQFIKDMSKISKNVINNKINLSNMFYLNGKLCLAEWEYSAFKEQNKIQGNHFQLRVEPILKFQKDWLVSPQYLAPQILQSIQDTKKSFDLWEFQNSSDIYSIGLCFIQIITLIPMWMQFKTSVKSKILKPRQGLLCTSFRSTMRILQKQKILSSRISMILERQVSQGQKNWRFFNILIRMIEPDRAKRITIDQLIKQVE